MTWSLLIRKGDGDRGARIESLNRIKNRRVREPGNVSDRTHLTVEVHAGQTTIQPCGAPAAGNTQTRDAPKGADGEGAVGEVTEGVAQRHLASSPAGDGFKAGGVHLPHLIRTAVEGSAAEVFEKNITLGPELLEVEGSENAGDRFQTAVAELIGPVCVRRFAHLQSRRDEAAAGGGEFEPGLVQSGDRRVLRVQYGRVLAEGRSRRRSRFWLGLGTSLGGRADAHAENQQRRPDCSHSWHAFHP